ncbi:HU family DNA-binding protein [Oceaniglobus roseus]|uniref:HU family DNA-binding protein n=1 Tax=Oceaniglobus roseus TaxID=1737570 RepID=UPI001FEB630B|nr:HU family DNA-binding protein [Kandeliimicrobium roseum]
MTDDFDPDAPKGTAPMTVVEEVSPVATAAPMKKIELIESVSVATGLKKKDAKLAVEAALAILGQGLAEGREMNLPPLGKVSVNRTMNKANATVVVAKIRQPSAMPKPDDPLAPADEDG